MKYQTPLARARGLGSAKQGSHHWWRQRVTAVALFPLTLWFATSIALLPGLGHAEVVRWINSPWNTILLLSFILISLFHAMLGLQVVIEDYVHNDWLKILGNLGVRLVTAFLALDTAFAVLRIVFVGAHG
ncbi:MAG: succinate dehydrogenase, hydrophobic membrane anchor protein [Candidatus Methylumidiphilus sp.]